MRAGQNPGRAQSIKEWVLKIGLANSVDPFLKPSDGKIERNIQSTFMSYIRVKKSRGSY